GRYADLGSGTAGQALEAVQFALVCEAGSGGADARAAESRRQLGLFHDLFGNPFRPVAVDPAWLTSDVVALAGGIDAERAFDRLPILADALQDAGCTSDEILNHCRDAHATHVR